MSEHRITKAERYAEIAVILRDESYEELADFCDAEVESLEAKAAKAKERAAVKRAEGDEYKAIVAGALTDELQTGQAIFDAVGDEDLSLGKVRSRLTMLVHDGAVEKEEVSVTEGEKTRKVMAYRLA
jgi:hypothetical protein